MNMHFLDEGMMQWHLTLPLIAPTVIIMISLTRSHDNMLNRHINTRIAEYINGGHVYDIT